MKKNIKLLTALFGFMVLNNGYSSTPQMPLAYQWYIVEDQGGNDNLNAFHIPNLTQERENKIKKELIAIASRCKDKRYPMYYSHFLIRFIKKDAKFFNQSNTDNLFRSKYIVNSLMYLFEWVFDITSNLITRELNERNERNELGIIFGPEPLLGKKIFILAPFTEEEVENVVGCSIPVDFQKEYDLYESLSYIFNDNFYFLANFPVAPLGLFETPLTNEEYNYRSQQIKKMSDNDCKEQYEMWKQYIAICLKPLFSMLGIQLPGNFYKQSITQMKTLLEKNWKEIESDGCDNAYPNTVNWMTQLKTNPFIQQDPKFLASASIGSEPKPRLIETLFNYSRNLFNSIDTLLIKFEDKYPKENDENFTKLMKKIMLQNLEETQFLSMLMNENKYFFEDGFSFSIPYEDAITSINGFNMNEYTEKILSGDDMYRLHRIYNSFLRSVESVIKNTTDANAQFKANAPAAEEPVEENAENAPEEQNNQ